jgi:predicted transcriptional regulator
MINKKISQYSELPLYEVEEMSLLDAMILLKRQRGRLGETSIARAAERLKPAPEPQQDDAVHSFSGS